MPGDPAAVTDDHGMWRDKDGDPTYKVSADGTVDWYTYSGFRRYHSECHVCHGPDGEGSSYAPALAENKNVMCYLDDIYVYLRARSQDAVARGRPAQHADKPAAFDEAQDKC